MCAECPFRANAVRGWLGPSTPEQVNNAARGEEPYICHLDIERMADNGADETEIEVEGQHCVGMSRYRNSICKGSRDPEQFKFQQELKKIPDKPLIPPNKFLEYHSASATQRKS